MIRLLLATSVLVLMMPNGVKAGNMKPIEFGSWSLYTFEDYPVAVGGKHVTIRGACVAETVNGNHKLALVTFPPFVNKKGEQLSSSVTGQVTSSDWKFRVHSGALTLSSQSTPPFNIQIEDALFDDDMIMFTLGGYGEQPPELMVFSEVAAGTITLIDKKDKVLSSFNSDGLASIYIKLLECGGIQ